MPQRDLTQLGRRLALSVAEAAQALRISGRHLRAHLSEIPHLRIGGRAVFPVDALRTWLTEQARREQARAELPASEILDTNRSAETRPVVGYSRK